MNRKTDNHFFVVDNRINKWYAVIHKDYSFAGVAQLVEQLICNQ